MQDNITHWGFFSLRKTRNPRHCVCYISQRIGFSVLKILIANVSELFSNIIHINIFNLFVLVYTKQFVSLSNKSYDLLNSSAYFAFSG